MAARKFSLKDVLAENVSDLDTRERIEYIDLDLIDPDPENFYSLDGLEELAGNIELIGLQQPLRVRPVGGRYTIISGHRRRAACLLIRDGGSEQFADGVPCIVEHGGQDSKAMQELKLIYANSSTRVLSSAEISRQAERVQELLYQLKEEGVEFPGRMRDHVAAACQVSASKIARLHAIRENLVPEILKLYDSEKINESVAYELSRFSEASQRAIKAYYDSHDKNPKYWYAGTVEDYGKDIKRLASYTCPAKFGGGACDNQDAMLEEIWKHGYHNYVYCAGEKRCCATCGDLASCGRVCKNMLPKAEQLRKERREKNKEMKAAEKAAEQPLVDRVRSIWLRFGNALSRANMEDEDLRKITGRRIYQLDAAQISSLEAGEHAPKIKAGTVLPFFNSCYLHEIASYIETADALDCSLDYLFCRTDVPEINRGDSLSPSVSAGTAPSEREPSWKTGTPTRDGRYLCQVDLGLNKLSENKCDFRDGQWTAYGRPVSEVGEVVGWWPLPEG